MHISWPCRQFPLSWQSWAHKGRVWCRRKSLLNSNSAHLSCAAYLLLSKAGTCQKKADALHGKYSSIKYLNFWFSTTMREQIIQVHGPRQYLLTLTHTTVPFRPGAHRCDMWCQWTVQNSVHKWQNMPDKEILGHCNFSWKWSQKRLVIHDKITLEFNSQSFVTHDWTPSWNGTVLHGCDAWPHYQPQFTW